jgi:hypothetical protein
MIKTVLLFCSALTFGQGLYVSTGTDMNFLNAKFGMVSNQGVEVTLGYEPNSQLEFNRMYMGAGYQFWLNSDAFCFVPSVEPSLINRSGGWGTEEDLSDDGSSSHLSLGLNLAMRYEISDALSVEYSPNFLLRTDIKAKYPQDMWDTMTIGQTPVTLTNFVTLVYKFYRL